MRRASRVLLSTARRARGGSAPRASTRVAVDRGALLLGCGAASLTAATIAALSLTVPLVTSAPACCAPAVASPPSPAALAKADAMFDNSNAHTREELYAFLLALRRDDGDAEPSASLAWRLARAAYNLAETLTDDKERRRALHYAALEAARAALEADATSFKAHSWVGIALSKVGDYEGDKATIKNSFVVQQHWLKAVELNPRDAYGFHLLGQWAFAIADLAYYKRVVASVVFATPPEASFEEALEFFTMCEELEPGATKANGLMMARTLRKLDRQAEAVDTLRRLLQAPSRDADDRAAEADARALLKEIFK